MGGKQLTNGFGAKIVRELGSKHGKGMHFFSEIYIRCPVVYFGMRYSSLITLQKLLIHAFVVVAFGFAKNVYL